MMHRDDGFTLVELLIAIAIIGALMAILVSAIGIARQSAERADKFIKSTGEQALLNRVLRDALAQVVRTQNDNALLGTARTLTVRTVAPRVPALTGIILLSVEPDTNGDGAIILWQPVSQPQDAIKHRLLRAGHQLWFSYFDPAKGWSNAWNEREAIPSVIRASILDESGDEPRVDLDIPLRSVLSLACAGGRTAPQGCGARQ